MSTSCGEEVLFSIDTLSKIISYLPSIDVLNLALACKRFGVSNNSGDDVEQSPLIEESTSIAIHGIASEEQLAAIPYYDGEGSLADYHYLQLMRKPLTFDQLVGRMEYVNEEDKSCVKYTDTDGYMGTAFSNSILRAGKHYASFFIGDFGSLFVGVMKPGEANQTARGFPVRKEFYEHFSRRLGHGEHTNNNNVNSVQCCLYNTLDPTCWTSDWVQKLSSERLNSNDWGGMESVSSIRQSITTSGLEIGMLLDLNEGTLSVYKNGRKLGVMKRGLAGPYCWVASMFGGAQVTIKRGRIPLEEEDDI